MLIAVAKAANMLKAARIIVEVLTDLLFWNTSPSIICAFVAGDVLLASDCVKWFAVWFIAIIVLLNDISSALPNMYRTEAAIMFPDLGLSISSRYQCDRRQRAWASGRGVVKSWSSHVLFFSGEGV
jgi:hypothetical protein